MASRETTLLRPELLAVWNDISAQYAHENPEMAQPFIDCTYRSNIEQDADYAQGRTTEGSIITWARGGQSAHNTQPLASAFDIAFKNANGTLNWAQNLFNVFNALVQAKYSATVNWGGYFPKGEEDYPHFELSDWKSYRDNQESDSA